MNPCLLKAAGMTGSESVSELQIRPGPGKLTEIVMTTGEQPRRRITFSGVQQAVIPTVAPRGLALGEAFLEDVSGDQLEHVRFRLSDELEAWMIECAAVSIEPLDQ